MQVIDLSADRGARKRPKRNLNALPALATVIAIDPGGTTGWSLMDVDPYALVDPKVKLLDSINIHQHGQVDCGSRRGNLADDAVEGISTTGEAAGVDDLLRLIAVWPAACVVVEDFILLQESRSRDLLSPVRINAALSFALWRTGRGIFTQPVNQAKSTAPDEALKRWGLYNKHGGHAFRHARDADRHAITWLRRCKASWELRASAWPHLYGEGRELGPAMAKEPATAAREAPQVRVIRLPKRSG